MFGDRQSAKTTFRNGQDLEKRVTASRMSSRLRKQELLAAKRRLIPSKPANEALLEQATDIVLSVKAASIATIREPLRRLRDLLSSGEETAIAQTVNAGLIMKLATVLENSETAIQLDILWCFTIPTLYLFLSSNNPLIQEQIIWCFGNLAGDSLEFQEILRHHDVPEAVLKTLPEEAKDAEAKLSDALSDFRKTVIWTLANLCRGPFPDDFDPFVASIPYTIAALMDSNSTIDAAWMLCYVTSHHVDEDIFQQLSTKKLLGFVFEILGKNVISDSSVSLPLLRLLGNLIAGPDPYAEAVVNFNPTVCISLLLTVLTDSGDDRCKTEACFVLGNISGTQTVAHQLVKPEVINVLSTVFSSGGFNFDMKREAAAVISNLCFVDPSFMLNSNILTFFPQLLKTHDTQMHSIVVGGISGILGRLGEDAAPSLVDQGVFAALNFLAESLDSNMAAQAVSKLAQALTKVTGLKKENLSIKSPTPFTLISVSGINWGKWCSACWWLKMKNRNLIFQDFSSSPQMKYFVFGIGNPLLDITAVVEPAYLEKYGLERGSAILAEEKHMPIYDEIVKKYDVKNSGGGATQNSIRIAASILGRGKCAYIGAVGDDETASTLKSCVEGDGVDTFYQSVEKKMTGTCAVLVVDRERTLVTALEAANDLSIDHINEHKTTITESKIIYSSGYVLTACPQVTEIAEAVSNTENCLYAVNLAAPFLAEVPMFRESMIKMIEHCAIVFGNDSEAKAFAKTQEWSSELEEIAKNIADMPFKGTSTIKRLVVITCGADATITCVAGESAVEHSVAVVPNEEIVDVNGAGDAFVGGFLSSYAQEKPLADCIRVAHEVAGVVIRRAGVSVEGIREKLEEEGLIPKVAAEPEKKETVSPPMKRARAYTNS
ncbi:hypothetical protein P9112_012759 [Eukaryota sp. TZLM1-RC]